MILWLPDFRFIWSPSNYAVHRRGFDLGGSIALPASGVQVQGTWSHTDVTYAGPVLSGQVAYRPQTTATATAVIAPGRWRTELSNRYVGERRTVPGSALNALDPYWLTDLRSTTAFTHDRLNIEMTAGLENVFDRPAAMLVDYPFPGRTWTIAFRMRHLPSI